MDSRIVSRELWKAVRPLLKESGWTSFTTRTARRFSDSHVDVINFQSFNSYLASVIGCTTYSFSIRLGCFLRAIPYPRVKLKDDFPMPAEYQCHLRRTLYKAFPQPECSRTDVFYIDPDGNYLPTVTEAVRGLIATEGLNWFERFSNMQEVLRTLVQDNETAKGTWGFGRDPSPARHLYRGYVALSLGETERALKDLRSAASSSSFQHLREQIEGELSRISHR